MRQAYIVHVAGQCPSPKHGEWISLTFALAHDHGEAIAAGVRNATAPHVECPPNAITRAFAGPVAPEVIAEAARELAHQEQGREEE